MKLSWLNTDFLLTFYCSSKKYLHSWIRLDKNCELQQRNFLPISKQWILLFVRFKANIFGNKKHLLKTYYQTIWNTKF